MSKELSRREFLIGAAALSAATAGGIAVGRFTRERPPRTREGDMSLYLPENALTSEGATEICLKMD